MDAAASLDPFAGLLDQVGPESSRPPNPPLSQGNSLVPTVNRSIDKLNYTHDAMIDMMIADPGIGLAKLAKTFGYTIAWISTVQCSDIFQARLMERTAEVVDPQLHSIVEARLKGVLNRSLEVLQEKLEGPEVSDQLALQAATLSSKALGFGAREQTVKAQVNLEVHLEQLGGRLTSLLVRKRGEVIEHQPKEIANGPGNSYSREDSAAAS